MFAARPPQGIPDDDASWDMQEHCQALLADAGYAQYEVSAYARPGPAVRAQPQLLALRRLPRHRRRRARQAHARAPSRPSCGAGRSSTRRSTSSRPGTPAAIGGDDRDRAGAAPVRIHAQCPAAGRRLQPGRLRGPHRAGARGDRRAAARRPRHRAGSTIDGDRVRPDRAGPALHQRRGRAVPRRGCPEGQRRWRDNYDAASPNLSQRVMVDHAK